LSVGAGVLWPAVLGNEPPSVAAVPKVACVSRAARRAPWPQSEGSQEAVRWDEARLRERRRHAIPRGALEGPRLCPTIQFSTGSSTASRRGQLSDLQSIPG
jgi:hypothetical protein